MVTIEMVEEFRRRTNCSYDDAKYYLEKYNGDMLEAIIAFERGRNHGYQHKHGGLLLFVHEVRFRMSLLRSSACPVRGSFSDHPWILCCHQGSQQ
jgi:hypothetical protein